MPSQRATHHVKSGVTHGTGRFSLRLGLLALSVAILFPGAVSFAQPVSFSPATNFPVGTSPNRVAIGDLDGDLIPDLAVAKLSDNIITILLGNGAGSFSFAMNLTAVSQSRSVAIADLDLDGKPDLAVANLDCCNPTPISVFRNTSTGGSLSFAPKVDFFIGFQPYSLVAGDINGDGKPDLAAVLIGWFSVGVLRNTSTSGSITASSFAFPAFGSTGINPWGVAIGDIDGDGKPELAVANLSTNTVSVFRNTSTIGTISFDPKVDFATGTGSRSVAIGDLDGDGKLDLAVTNQNNNTVSVLRNTSTSGSITASSFAGKVDFSTGSLPYSVSIGDLDGDGKPDLAVTNQQSNTVSVLQNTSTSGSITASSFAAKVNFATGNNPAGGAIGDLNGDGKPDLATANQSSNNVSILLNTTPGPNQPPVADAGPDQTVEATGPSGASVPLNGAGSSDPDSNPLTYAWSGSFVTASGVSPTVVLPLGAHILTLTVDDGQATATDTVYVSVVDTTPPVLTLPANLIAEATGPAGATVSFSATAMDLVDGARPVICTPSSGSLFVIGTTPVNCSSSDTQGTTALGSFNVTVQDTTPPNTSITSAVDGNAATVGNGGSTVSNAITLTMTGTDAVGVSGFQCSLDVAAYASCTSPVGYASFATGSHTVQVRALDAAGNVDASPASIMWTVLTPSQAIQNLINTIGTMGLPNGVETSLKAPLGQASALLNDNNPNNDGAVCGKLGAFINQVNTKAQNGQLTSAQASQLLNAANAIKTSLGC